MLVCNFLYCWEILLRRVEVVDCNLIHCNVHYWTVASVAVVTVEIRLSYVRYAAVSGHSEDTSAMFLLHLFAWLENRRKQTLILHKRTIMVVFADVTHTSGHRAGIIVLEVTVECLGLAVVNFQVSKVSSTMLSC